MSSPGYKDESRKLTARRVQERSQRYSPAGDPLRDLDDRIEREPDLTPGSFEEFQARVMRSWNADLRDLAKFRRLLERAVPLAAFAVDIPSRELEAEQFLQDAREALSSAPRASTAPTSSTGDTNRNDDPKEPPLA